MSTILLAALLAASTTADTFPAYCGRAGSGVEELRAPDGPAILRSVQVVARHGARAPVADCGRWLPRAAGAAWTCPGEALEGVAPGSTYRLRSGAQEDDMCGPGELLEEGFAQHRALGHALRAAYREPGTVETLPVDGISLRSSDLPRTRRSAEALADAFAPSDKLRDLHAPTFATDWIYPNSNECPALSDLEKAAFGAPAFMRRNASALGALAARLEPALGTTVDFGIDGMAGGHLLDCAMAAACSKRAFALPRDDVDALVAAMEQREASKLTLRYARTVTAPLVAALRDQLANATGLSVFLAHDTTLMPLLVALTTDYDGRWAPYAAAVVLEAWTLPDGSDAIRVAYDGSYRTLAGCPDQLCPLHDFLAATAWVRDRDCAVDPRAGTLRIDAAAGAGAKLLITAFLAGAAVALLATRGLLYVDWRLGRAPR